MPDFGASVWAPLLIGAAGATASGIGQAGKQGSQASTSTSKEEGQQSSTSSINQSTKPTEDANFSAFRNTLLPLFGQEFSRAQQPVYGKAQQASFMEGVNSLTEDATKALRNQLAGVGALDSGRFERGATDIERSRLGKLVDFNAQLPFQEAQARSARMNPLLALASQFAGRAPLGQETTGSQSSTTTSSGTRQQQGNTDIYGQPAWRSIFNSVGGWLGTNPLGLGQGGGTSNQTSGGSITYNPYSIGDPRRLTWEG